MGRVGKTDQNLCNEFSQDIEEVIASTYELKIKPIIDKILSFAGLILLSPLYVAISVAIYIDDPGPIFFTQKRVGKDKRFFLLHKFRTMRTDTPHDVPTHQLTDPDKYITKVGGVLRKTSLDEIPQIWDIFRGKMSIIGPRPALWNQKDLIEQRELYGANNVFPGLTGLAQIRGRDELEIADKARIDGEYVSVLKAGGINALVQDASCFISTIGSVLKHEGVVEGGTGKIKNHRTVSMKKAKINNLENCNVESEDYGYKKNFKIDKMTCKRVLITGIDSYIGDSFISYANEHYPNLTIDSVDMKNENWKSFDFSLYDTVFHVAGIAHVDVGNMDEQTKNQYYAVNRDLAIETAEIAKESGVKQFLFMSSMIIYGDSAAYGKEKVIDEYTIPTPSNFYGDSKLQGDLGVQKLKDNIFHVAIIRPPMIYGYGSKGNYPMLAKLAKFLPMFPDINNRRSMLHIDNFCEFVSLLILSGEGGIYFPQNMEYTKTSSMVQEIADVAGHPIKISRLLNPTVWIASFIPGKISELINKAFGNFVYTQKISVYNGLDYRVVDLKKSIRITELVVPYNKKNKFEEHKLTDLKNKRILLIALPGYRDGLIAKMRKLGADVDLINDKPNEGFICKTLGRCQVGFYQKVISNYYKKKLESLKNRNYDYILSIRGEYTPIDSLKLIKEFYPNSKLVLYMWDGLGKLNTKGIEEKWRYYDKVYTFDRIDYEIHKDDIDFLPLYYYEDYVMDALSSQNTGFGIKDTAQSGRNVVAKNGLSFIGTGHGDRIRIVKSVMKQCKEHGMRCFSYFFIPHPLVFYWYKALNRNFKDVRYSEVHFSMMPFEKVYRIYTDSTCIIDVENIGQHGLTMRSIEILGLRRKLITTNKDIVNYEFYNPNNIYVLDRENPVIDMSFFDRPYEMLDEEVYQKYSLENWILEVLK